MSTQYIDGSFGEAKPFHEAMEEFMNAVESNTAKSFHVGTKDELEQMKDEKKTSDQIAELRAQVKDLSAQVNSKKIIYTPTFREVQALNIAKE